MVSRPLLLDVLLLGLRILFGRVTLRDSGLLIDEMLLRDLRGWRRGHSGQDVKDLIMAGDRDLRIQKQFLHF